ncbi:hypothetical protein QI339_12485 [Staphylococcus saprophyticus]|nr:hypothetical protein [Staphylococcus saprophyticus]
MTKKTTTMQEYEPFMDKTVKINGIDGKTRRAKLVAVYTYSIMLETNINTKEEPIVGYMLYMKQAIKSISQIPE